MKSASRVIRTLFAAAAALTVVVASAGTASARPYGWWIFTPPTGSFTALAVTFPHPGYEQMIWTPRPDIHQPDLGPNGYLLQAAPPRLMNPPTLTFGEWGGQYFYRLDNMYPADQGGIRFLGPVVGGPQRFLAAYDGFTVGTGDLYTLTWPAGSTQIRMFGYGYAQVGPPGMPDWAGVGFGWPITPKDTDYAVVSFGFDSLWWTACGVTQPVPTHSWFRGC